MPIRCIRVEGLQVKGYRIAGVLLFPLRFAEAILIGLVCRKTRNSRITDLHGSLLNGLETVQKEKRDTNQYDQYRKSQPLLAREQKDDVLISF